MSYYNPWNLDKNSRYKLLWELTNLKPVTIRQYFCNNKQDIDNIENVVEFLRVKMLPKYKHILNTK